MKSLDDIIIALATPYGSSALGVIRISGKNIFTCLQPYFQHDIERVWPKNCVYNVIIDKDKNIIDEVVCLLFKAPHSFTSEDIVEIMCHGNMIIINKIINLFTSNISNMRIAERGEFAKRAYLNNKIDLIQAESINDLINAHSESALKIANQGLHQQTTLLINSLIKKLITIIGNIEVQIDYPEYEDAIEFTNSVILSAVNELLADIKVIIDDSILVKPLLHGVKLAIVGEPNVGKSSLLNILLDQDKAIITSLPGTTRDVVEGQFALNEFNFLLFDTAGFRETKNIVEQAGIKKSKIAINEADIILFLRVAKNLNSAFSKTEAEIQKLINNKPYHVFYNKSDLIAKLTTDDSSLISCTKKDIKNVLKFLLVYCKSHYNLLNNAAFLHNERQVNLLKNTRASLEKLVNLTKQKMPIDIISDVLQEALINLNYILGKHYDQEELLNDLFSQFCIGK